MSSHHSDTFHCTVCYVDIFTAEVKIVFKWKSHNNNRFDVFIFRFFTQRFKYQQILGNHKLNWKRKRNIFIYLFINLFFSKNLIPAPPGIIFRTVFSRRTLFSCFSDYSKGPLDRCMYLRRRAHGGEENITLNLFLIR